MTAADIITDALIAIGELSRGQTASPEDLQHGLYELNGLTDSWSNDRLSLYTVTKQKFPLTPGLQDYSIGPSGATFTQARPVLIQDATIILGS